MPCATPKYLEFKLKLSAETALINLNILSKYYYNLGKALKARQDSPLGYCKELKPTNILKSVFWLHPLWQCIEAILTNGSKCPLFEISKDKQKTDLNNALAFGTHKSSPAKPSLLQKLIGKDLKHGHSLPIPLAIVPSIPGLEMAPVNIMAQNTIDKLGLVIPKDRLTYDQNWKWSSGNSVNSRVQKEILQECRYSFCIHKLINWAVAARQKSQAQKF